MMDTRHFWLLGLLLSAAAVAGCAGEQDADSPPAPAAAPPPAAACTGDACPTMHGAEGAACFENHTCNTGLACTEGTCAKCAPGSPGCACDTGDTCTGGLACVAGRCMSDGAAKPMHTMSVDTKLTACYTPCTAAGQTVNDANGQPHVCINGYLDMCLGNLVCNDGSCVAPGNDPPSCKTDVNCGSWQRCFVPDGATAGRCYSDCSDDLDCIDEGRVCHDHACRKACSDTNRSCTSGTEACDPVNKDQSGYCMPATSVDAGTAPVQVVGTFDLSDRLLAMSNLLVRLPLKITNNAPRAITFHIKKIEKVAVGAPQPAQPLAWLAIGPSGSTTGASAATEQDFRIDGSNTPATSFISLDVSIASGVTPPSSADGVIEISSKELGTQNVAVSFRRSSDSRWSGKAYYFSRFGDDGIDDWLMRRGSTDPKLTVGNAFVQRWRAFRTGGMASADELDAMIEATSAGTWHLTDRDNQTCASMGGAACYPYTPAKLPVGAVDNGLRVYSTDLDLFPIPSQPTDLPIALDLQVTNGNKTLQGRIASDVSMQYAGDPAITIQLDKDAATCLGNRADPCIDTIKSISGSLPTNLPTASVGARSVAPSNGLCDAANGFKAMKTPWLLHDFVDGTFSEPGAQDRYKIECRDTLLPWGSAVADSANLNESFAAANPIADGRSRRRTIELVDGALVNKEKLYILFRERFDDSFVGGTEPNGFYIYGLMSLRRSDATVDSFAGNAQTDTRATGKDLSQDVTCSADVLAANPAWGSSVTAANADGIASTLLNGNSIQGNCTPGTDGCHPYLDQSVVHYLCGSTNKFDTADTCPLGSNVVYFTADALPDLSKDACNATGACSAKLTQISHATNYRDLTNYWKCSDGNAQVYCDADRADLRHGKVFLTETTGAPPMLDLLTEVDRAFRYKTQFRARDSNATVGFAPTVCTPGSTDPPYCYDVAEIKKATQRVDCLVRIYKDHYGDLTPDTQQSVKAYLTKNFSYDTEITTAPDPIKHDGFEPMYAELLGMLGDEAYTSAVRERFDLAGANGQTFYGQNFEPGGGQIPNGLGFEMYKLHQAVQYYQMALDRFYAVLPLLWASLQSGTSNYVQQEMVSDYLPRLIHASTQKAAAWNEIGKRYQQNREADVGKRVMQRAYTSAHIESILLAHLMQNVVTVSSKQTRDAVITALDSGRQAYQQALLQIRDKIDGLNNEVSYFGFPPGFVPFPALDKANMDAVEIALATADGIIANNAGPDEQKALSSAQKFDTDSAEFQQALQAIANNYDTQLAQICGYIPGTTYPATTKYASLDPRARALGDPCGLMGSGAINDALGDMELKQIDIQLVQRQFEKVSAQSQIEIDRINNLCSPQLPDGGKGAILTYADVKWARANGELTLKDKMEDEKTALAAADRTREVVATTVSLMHCIAGTATDCPGKAAASGVWLGVSGALSATAAGLEGAIAQQQKDVDQAETDGIRFDIQQQCVQEQINSTATLQNIALQTYDLDLQALKADYAARLSMANLLKLHNQASALRAQQLQAEQTAIDVEAAKNDPNVRIFKNADALQADRSFNDAMTAAYQALLVYEYYAATKYEHHDDIFGIRMINAGVGNGVGLKQYLSDLHKAYSDFKQAYGKPQPDTLVLSLMDDILQIPRAAPDGTAYTVVQRQALLRAEVAKAAYVDSNGYITFPFSTSFSRLSSQTADHKITKIEVEVGATRHGVGGKLYVLQRGGSTLRTLANTPLPYRIRSDVQGHVRQAIVNVFYNGYKDPTTNSAGNYDNTSLQDYPVVNGDWELSFNPVEFDNAQLDLGSITDIKLYVFYQDLPLPR